jgi:metal-dependent HD superfamily phosphatase/phosphodiesterase
MMVASKVGLDESETEYAGIAGFCHDMGNFLGRDLHHHWASLLFHQVFSSQINDIEGMVKIMQAISNHDKDEAKLVNNTTAVLIIADKSDVHRDRVKEKDKEKVKLDIHNRVNYSITRNDLDVNPDTKIITLMLDLDQKFTPIMDYFEIFTGRMNYCRKSAEYLGYRFKLVINDFELL